MSKELDFDNLSEEDKEWLRSWNRHSEIPGEEPPQGEPATGFESRQEAAADEAPGGYDEMSKTALKEEIERRNSARPDDEHLAVSGNKEELIGRLEEDDQE